MKTPENKHTHYFEDIGLNLNCKKATYLLSVSTERKLIFKERVGLFFHFLICKGCRMFKKQFDFLNEVLRKIERSSAEKNFYQLSGEEKKKMQYEIDIAEK